MEKRAEGRSSYFGVRGRLLLAFFGISAFAVLAAAAAMYFFVAIGDVLDRITQERVPSALASLELSRQAERIVAAAPALLAATTPEQRDERARTITAEADRLGGFLADLRGGKIDPVALETIERAVAGLRSNLERLDDLVAKNLALAERKSQMVRGVHAANDATQRLLSPWVLITESRISELRASAENAALAGDARISVLVDLVEANWARERLQEAQLEASLINDTLLQAASAETPDRLSVLQFRQRHRMSALEKLGDGFDPKLRALLATQIDAFRGLAEGADSLPAARVKELELAELGAALLQENAELARGLTLAVERLVEGAKNDIEAAGREAQSAQRLSAGVLAAIVLLSLVSSTLIVWLYVGRNLIARVTALSDSMLAIAGGDLRARLPASGRDEIGRMAAALSVFRDTAVEVEEKNLRDIAEARQRLIDAIESISEGFSFYDKDDRLVLCNSRYREMLYPGLGDVVEPGASFESIIRDAAERGLVRDAEGRIEDWIEERMARHRDPQGAFLMRRGDGRWIEVTEHKISGGGTVAIYADITDKKSAELALLDEKRRTEEANKLVTEKNQMLESLSAKLSKYLAPQVYASIFRGQQSVEIATERKKLTVFFSDIAGFTEATESLESEELTSLLNRYLTEMSRIALDHGATIDKYIGDAIMLFFGDPETRGVKQDAVTCVKMAVAMQRRMRVLQSEWRDRGLEVPFQLRIGINTGFCTVGNFGSEDRMDYTIIGNEVNLAARLQAHAELGGIIMTHETYSLVKDVMPAEEGSPITLKGIAKPVRTYRVTGIYDGHADDGKIYRKEEDGVRLYVNLNEMDRAEAVKAIEKFLSEIER